MKKHILVIIFLVLALFLSACSHLPSPNTDAFQGGATLARPSNAATQPESESPQQGADLQEALRNLADSTFSDYSLMAGNEDLTTLAEQWARLQLFMQESIVRTTRRGIVMDTVVSTVAPPFSNLDDILLDCGQLLDLGISFNVGFTCQNHLQNEWLIAALLEFTEICRNNIRFEVMGDLAFGMTAARSDLTQSQELFLICLESYMAVKNAPFWADMYNNDPVITHIGLPSATRTADCYQFFTIWLYNPDLLGLSQEELDSYTADMRAEILGFIEADPYYFEFRVTQEHVYEDNPTFP
ncbi:MAG: hypothetical protein FWE42_09185 [Defluviitaleaceae bacterium]|nr:hypothetical protein [Defluviitaleaceae bacterium]